MRMIVLGGVVGLAVVMCGCGGEKPEAPKEPAATAARAEKGELFLDKSDLMPPEEKPGQINDHAVELYQKMPQAVGVKVIEHTERRLVLDLDWAALNAAARGRAAKESQPARIVYDVTPVENKSLVRMRAYYTGDDPAVAEKLRAGFKGTPMDMSAPAQKAGKAGAAK